MTQLIKARENITTPEMKKAAIKEGVSPEFVRKGIAEGNIVITKNKKHDIEPLAIGAGLRTKVNANIGTSQDKVDIDLEIEKLKAAVDAGADAVMDLSTGGDIDKIRKAIIKESPVSIGTVPVYQAALEAVNKGKSFVEL
ncbi:MAG: phosphomethylpyrimidine synthase ThiC, partial [Deltaproteobacteria bacterium]|nr:phosphomethylpyrimidine synthase ThiC [Deltaproteobacteria bacterium]